ncbi:MAG: hypothetical protein C0501_31725 [Isosphaera sp.]|nr:hypothetical protein [Isosphaera sp.]
MGRLSAELLEARDTPASIGLDAAGVLQVQADDVGAVLTVWQDAGGDYNVYFDDRGADGPRVLTFSGAAVTGINFVGGSGNDVFFNATGLSDAADLGAGDDYYIGGTGAVSQVSLGDGNDVALTRADNNIVDAADGAANGDRVFNFAGTLSINSDANDTLTNFGTVL